MKALTFNESEQRKLQQAEQQQTAFVFAVGQKYQFQIPLN